MLWPSIQLIVVIVAVDDDVGVDVDVDDGPNLYNYCRYCYSNDYYCSLNSLLYKYDDLFHQLLLFLLLMKGVMQWEFQYHREVHFRCPATSME
jgi:hypothetical protein